MEDGATSKVTSISAISTTKIDFLYPNTHFDKAVLPHHLTECIDTRHYFFLLLASFLLSIVKGWPCVKDKKLNQGLNTWRDFVRYWPQKARPLLINVFFEYQG